MNEQEMLEAEKYWCENCCNWDKDEVQMDAYSTCKLTGTRIFDQESGKECKCFNVPAENVIVPLCKVGDTVYFAVDDYHDSAVIDGIHITEEGILFTWVQYEVGYELTECWDEGEFDIDQIGKTVFLTRKEALSKLQASCEQVKGGAE